MCHCEYISVLTFHPLKHFITFCVLIYIRWHVCAGDLLQEFHERHKPLMMSRNSDASKLKTYVKIEQNDCQIGRQHVLHQRWFREILRKKEELTCFPNPGVCSFSWNLHSFPVNSQKLGVQAPQNVEFE